MEQLRNLLTWNMSARDPVFLCLILSFMALLTVVLIERPRLYLPMVLFTTPLPKLFTIASYSNSASSNAAPGFSVVDMVLASGIAALLFRRRTHLVTAESRAFARALVLWSASVLISVLVGFWLWTGTYRGVNIAYAFRYLLTLASFGVAVQYGYHETRERSLHKLLQRLAVAGNITLTLSLIYYFEIGSSGAGARGINLAMEGGSGVYRSYLWFFDYGNDMGFYAAMIGVLNVILLSDRRLLTMRLLNTAGLLLSVIAILLIGERADVLVIAVALTYFVWETSRRKHRSVSVSAVFQVACILAVVLAFGATMAVVSPEFITGKLQNSVGVDNRMQESTLAILTNAGVPESIGSIVGSLPIGDLAVRLAYNIAGLWYFFSNPEGVGFWGQLDATGFYSHHEVVTVAIEQGIWGLAAFLYFLSRLRRLLWSGRNLPGAAGQLGVLLRAISVGLFMALVMANTVLLDMKFALVYWSLLGLWSIVPRDLSMAGRTAMDVGDMQPELVHA